MFQFIGRDFFAFFTCTVVVRKTANYLLTVGLVTVMDITAGITANIQYNIKIFIIKISKMFFR